MGDEISIQNSFWLSLHNKRMKTTKTVSLQAWPIRNSLIWVTCVHLHADRKAERWERNLWNFSGGEESLCVKVEVHYAAALHQRNWSDKPDFLQWKYQNKNRKGKNGLKIGCMAPQLCAMNPTQGSPPSAAPGETSPEERVSGSMGTDELDLSSVRRFKSKSSDLPFSVESLIADRTTDRCPLSSEPSSGCGRTEETECASPRGLYRSTAEAVDLSDRETSSWFHAPYASPPSECRNLFWNHGRRNERFFYLVWSLNDNDTGTVKEQKKKKK